MKNPTMLYRCPGAQNCGGVMCQTLIVDEADVEAHVAEGWHTHFLDAQAAHTAEKLQANEQEQREIERKLALQAVHRGRGKYEVIDSDGKVIASGLSKEEAQAKVGG